MVVESCKAGLPAIGNGEFAVVGFTDICAPPSLPLKITVTKVSRNIQQSCTPCFETWCYVEAQIRTSRGFFSSCADCVGCTLLGADLGSHAYVVSLRRQPLLMWHADMALMRCRHIRGDGQHDCLCILHSAHCDADAARDASWKGRISRPLLVHAPRCWRCAENLTPEPECCLPP